MRLFKRLTHNIPGRQHLCVYCISFLLFFSPALTHAQKSSFTHYSSENGLLQSQVTKIMQDNTHQLVIQTFLGIERFDGKTFSPVTRDNMVTENFGAATTDNNGKIWFANS